MRRCGAYLAGGRRILFVSALLYLIPEALDCALEVFLQIWR